MGLLLVVASASCRQVFGIDDPSAGDAGSTGDAPAAIDAMTCAAASVECVGPDSLRTCTAPGVAPMFDACSWGCLGVGAGTDGNEAPHCGALQPQGGGVTPADLEDMSALADLTLQNATINATTGEILVGQTSVRAAGLGVIAGIDYEVRGKVAVFRMASALLGSVALTGVYPIALVANGDITISGDVDARGACTDRIGGPGGGNGGVSRNTGVGTGGGVGATGDTDAGGGAGYGAVGGAGGTSGFTPAAGGPAYGDATIMALLGGSGGGAGGASSATLSARGGGGGGGVQLVSNASIIVAGSINAGGCGGAGGATAPGGGGGGGGGGTVLLEAPDITVVGAVAANGGGGGGGGASAQPGSNATADAVAAVGGPSNHGDGGAGGNAAHPAGNAGANNAYAGGGGGAVGRLRFETRDGTVSGLGTTSPTPVTATATVQ